VADRRSRSRPALRAWAVAWPLVVFVVGLWLAAVAVTSAVVPLTLLVLLMFLGLFPFALGAVLLLWMMGGAVLLGRLFSAALRPARRAGRPITFDRLTLRVTDRQGQPHDCILEGDLGGAGLYRGDDVILIGRRRQDGAVRVREARVISTGAVLRPQRPAGSMTESMARIAWILVVIAALSIAF
jgi:hypothetical protein